MNGGLVAIVRDRAFPNAGWAVAWFEEAFPPGKQLNDLRDRVRRGLAAKTLTLERLTDLFVKEMETIVAETRDEVLRETYRGIAGEMRHPEFRRYLAGVLETV